MTTKQDAIGLEAVLDRSSPNCERELETFERRVEAWKRELGITYFVRAVREEGDRVFISIFPAALSAPEEGDRASPLIASPAEIEPPARSDGFERLIAARRDGPPALAPMPAAPRRREPPPAAPNRRTRTFSLE